MSTIQPTLSAAAGSKSFSRFRSKVANVHANTGNARILCIGDSTTAGNTLTVGTAANSWPHKLVGLLNADGTVAAPGIIFGGPLTDIADSRVTRGNLWVTTNGLPAYDRGWKGQVGGGVLSITFAETFDTITVHHLGGGGVTGVSTINVDGGASLGNISGAGSFLAKLTTTFSCAAGTHTINVSSPTGAQLWIVGIEVSLSSTKRLTVSNAGRPGSQTAHWISNAAGQGVLQTIQLAAPDLTIISLTINDATVPASTATVRTNLTTLIGYARAAGGNVLLVVPHACNGANFNTWQPQYADVIRSLSDSLNVGLLDLRERAPWKTYAAALSAGFIVDNAHPSAAGYADIAAAIYDKVAVV